MSCVLENENTESCPCRRECHGAVCAFLSSGIRVYLRGRLAAKEVHARSPTDCLNIQRTEPGSFLADVRGDVSGRGMGREGDRVEEKILRLPADKENLPYEFRTCITKVLSTTSRVTTTST